MIGVTYGGFFLTLEDGREREGYIEILTNIVGRIRQFSWSIFEWLNEEKLGHPSFKGFKIHLVLPSTKILFL